MKRLLTHGWWLGLLLVTTGCGADQEMVRVGNQGPSLALKTQNGDAIDRDALRGRFVLLNFWSTTCGPCIREIPELQALDDAGTSVVGIAVDPAGWKAVGPFVERHHMRYRVGLGDEALFLRCGGYGLPHSLLLDSNWQVVRIYRGTVTREAVEKDIQSAKRGAT